MYSDFPILMSKHLIIRIPTPQDAQKLRDYYWQNRTHLANWEPLRQQSFYSVPWWVHRIEQIQEEFREASAVGFVAFTKDEGKVVAIANFSNIIQGVFQSCNLGYSVDAQFQGKGIMSEFLTAVLDFIFENLGLHRVMASYIPVNKRSGALLERLGFEREGYARKYLKIAGKWQDHVLTSLLQEDWLSLTAKQQRETSQVL